MLFVRQMAWHGAVPEVKGPDGKPLAAVASRAQHLQRAGEPLDYPDLPPGGSHLVDCLLDAGPVVNGPMGRAPLSHVDIAAWMANTGTPCTPWDVRTLLTLSAAYLAESHAARSPTAAAPYKR